MAVGLLMVGGGLVAGVFGSLLGLGGGILIVPLLTLGFGLPLREAVGVSLVAVIMTSGASAAVYLERDVANLRLGMLLELFTAAGAVLGGAVAFLIDPRYLAGLFAVLLAYVAWTMLRSATRRREMPEPEASLEPVDLVPEPDASPGSMPAPSTAPSTARPSTGAVVDRLSR
ncbi:MAG TPA: sulfite exporter TauE/SafE family protein, partial [Candidatus Binatus sp.]|nr:sulfite exporter TauE/SafE family protein [Candidatus Binatus sp.]